MGVARRRRGGGVGGGSGPGVNAGEGVRLGYFARQEGSAGFYGIRSLLVRGEMEMLSRD
jgi:hypothetical protein